MKFTLHSLRWRLQLWHALISLVLIVAACFLADRLVTRERFDVINRDLFDFERSFFGNVLFKERTGAEDSPPSFQEIKSALIQFSSARETAIPSLRHLFESDPRQPYIVYWDKDGTPLFRSSNTPATVRQAYPSDGQRAWIEKKNNQTLEHYRTHPSGISMLIGRDVTDDNAALTRFRLLLALGGGALFLAALAGGWWLAGRALAPIDSISLTASRISEGNLDDRIRIQDEDTEINRLAGVLNNTFDKLSDSIDRQKRFTADASHELRTPLTIILSETQRGLRRDRDAESYRSIIGNCHTAAERMRRLVDSLLILAREDQPHGTGQPINLADVVSETAGQLAPIAEAHGSPISLDISPATVLATPGDLETLTSTLLSNALSHTPPGTSVTLSTRTSGSEAILEVHDNGQGIPTEHLPHLFDRFYQVDSARSQSQHHSGLGLAIAQSIATKLSGRITIACPPSGGTTATLHLPLENRQG